MLAVLVALFLPNGVVLFARQLALYRFGGWFRRSAERGALMGETFPLRAEALTVSSFGTIYGFAVLCLCPLRQNEIHGLIGPNGAGKTTLLRLLSGQDQPERGGAIWLHDQRVTHKPDWKRARLGLGRSFQRAQLFADMTVADNLVLAIRGCDFARGFDLSSGGDSIRWAAERAAREVFFGWAM